MYTVYSVYSVYMVRREVSRYITMPGQACSYKIGQIKILQLRERAKKALGKRFDLKAFHEVVLRSAGPLSIVEDEVNKGGSFLYTVLWEIIFENSTSQA